MIKRMSVFIVVMLAIALVNVSEVFLAKVSFNAGDFGFGLMWAAAGVGAVVGALFASSVLERRSMTAVYAVAISLMAFGYVAAAVSPNVWVAVWCILIGGIGNATAIICNSIFAPAFRAATCTVARAGGSVGKTSR